MGRIWRAETDLEKLKQLALLLLDKEVVTTEFSPLVVSHPFTDSGIVGMQDKNEAIKLVVLLDNPAGAQEWREQIGQQIKASDSALHLLTMVTKPYRLGYLKFALPYLSEPDAAKMLTFAWTSSESPNADPNWSKASALSLFRSIAPEQLMNAEEFEQFQRLGNVVSIYRGLTQHNAKRVKALSWTLSQGTAEWFAHRFGAQGTVYKAQIKKEHICALFLRRSESEVIIDPKHLMELAPLGQKMEKQGPSMAMGGM